jgi:hypothetical protein
LTLQWQEWGSSGWSETGETVPLAISAEGSLSDAEIVAIPGQDEFVFLYKSDDNQRNELPEATLKAARLSGPNLDRWEVWNNGWRPNNTAGSDFESDHIASVSGLAFQAGALFVLEVEREAQQAPELVELRYDSSSQIWNRIVIGRGATPRIARTEGDVLFLAYSREGSIILRKRAGAGWEPEQLVTHSASLTGISVIGSEPVVFSTRNEAGTGRLYAHATNGSTLLDDESFRPRSTPPRVVALPEEQGVLELLHATSVRMKVWDDDPAPDGIANVFRTFESSYGARSCGLMTWIPSGRYLCPHAFYQTVTNFPENYVPPAGYDDETGRGWGGGWEYFMFPTASAFDELSGTVYIGHEINQGGGGNQLPSGKLQLWNEAELTQHRARNLAGYPWPRFLGDSFGYTPRIMSDFDLRAGTQPLNYPAGMVVDSARRRLYLAEARADRVLQFNLDERGSPILASRQAITVSETLKFPQGLALDQAGNLFILDSGNSRIVVIAPNGEVLRSFGQFGNGIGELRYPYSISVDSSRNRVYVGDGEHPEIEVFSTDGTPLFHFSSVSDAGGGAPLVISQLGGLVAHDGRLWVSVNSRSIARIRIP